MSSVASSPASQADIKSFVVITILHFHATTAYRTFIGKYYEFHTSDAAEEHIAE